MSVEQPREGPTLVYPTGLIVQTGQALAEDTHNQECSHDVVGLYAHKGTMWNTDDRVPQKDIKSPYGGGVLTLPGAAGGHPPAMFLVASALPVDEPQLDSWQVIVVWVDETPAGDSSEQESPCDSQNRRRPMDINNPLNSLVHTVVQGGPVGPQGKEPLALLVLIHADPAGQRATIHRTTSSWECLPAQPEPPDGDRLVEVISDKDPTVCQVPGSALDSQLMEGTTYTEVSLDSRPMEGSSCQEPVEQLILLSSWTVSPRNCVIEQKSECEPVITPAINHNLDSRPMEGITYLEHPAPAVYLDSWPMEGEVRKQKVEWESVITPADSYTLDSRPMEGITYLEHPAPAVYLDSWHMEGRRICDLTSIGKF